MRDSLRKDLNNTKTGIKLSVLTLLLGALCAVFSGLAFPLYTAALSALMLYDRSPKRILSVLVPIAVCLLNLLFGVLIPTVVIFAIPCAVLVSFMYKKGMSKGECAGYLTAICSLMFVVGAFASAMLSIGKFSIAESVEFFKEAFDSFVELTVQRIVESAALMQEANAALLPEELIRGLLSSLVMSLPAIVTISAFALTGITFKAFDFVVLRFTDKPECIMSWRFSTSNLFAYFYLACLALSMFAGASDVLGLAISNLQSLFMAVYAYIGFNYCRYTFFRNKSGLFTSLILIVALITLSSLALSLLSFLGVYFTVMKNKIESRDNHEGLK